MPERIVFVHVETPRYADSYPIRYGAFSVEQQLVFCGVCVSSLYCRLASVSEYLFAFVARVKDVIVGKGVFVYITFVLATVTTNLFCRIFGDI